MQTVNSLTIRQPWSWLIVEGIKRVENRVWKTRYRGPLLIHAGKSQRTQKRDIESIDSSIMLPAEYDYGKIIGIVDLIDCIALEALPDSHRDQFAIGPWCWILANPGKLAMPLEWVVREKMFQVPLSVLKENERRRILEWMDRGSRQNLLDFESGKGAKPA